MFDQAIIPAKLYFCHLSAEYNKRVIFIILLMSYTGGCTLYLDKRDAPRAFYH